VKNGVKSIENGKENHYSRFRTGWAAPLPLGEDAGACHKRNNLPEGAAKKGRMASDV